MPEPIDDSIVATPSADNGNISVETEPTPAPSADPTPAVPPVDPAAPVPPTDPTPAPTDELFELPDGRKVDASTLSKEWKENFYPEYTRKSQALAAKETPNITPEPAKDSLDTWVPETHADIVRKAVEEVKAEQLREQQAQQAASQAIESEVLTQLTDVKTKDPTVNENALFLHATKYGFRDLRLAHQNMKDMSEIVKKTQTVTADNINKRNDPVSAVPGATGARPDPSQFSSAKEYYRSLTK